MAGLLKYFKSHKSLLVFTFLNIADKGLVFLTPFLLLSLFKEKDLYVQLEYIISTVNVFAAITDLGMGGYIFHLYQKSKTKSDAVELSKTVSEFIFIVLLLISLILIFFHYYIIPINILLLYILSRLIFIYLTVYLTSYFRIIDKPANSIYITLSVNTLALIFISLFYLFDLSFSLWLIFVPQVLLIFAFLIRTMVHFKIRLFSFKVILNTIQNSLRFSWPSIIQVFLMMYMANYGKINALERLSNSEAVFLGYTLRFCMVIQLAHASLVGFYAKLILSGEDKFIISKKVLNLYLGVLIFTGFIVITGLWVYQKYFIQNVDFKPDFTLSILFALYTLFWCCYSYLEMYYARINRNRVKLYLTILILIVFVVLLQLFRFSLLQNIAYAMFFSILVGLLGNIYVLKKLKFSLS